MLLDEIKNLLSLRKDGSLYHRESQTLEFKESFNFAGLSEYFLILRHLQIIKEDGLFLA